jgi:hypothetical protein
VSEIVSKDAKFNEMFGWEINMSEQSRYQFDYLKFQYEEATKTIRSWIDSRYRILQFVGYFNAAILTFGFSQGLLLSKTTIAPGIAICFLSLLVALMGFATEVSNRKYSVPYFEFLCSLEQKLNIETGASLDKVGLYSYGRDKATPSIVNRLFNLDRIQKIFYLVLAAFWCFLLIVHLKI